MKFKTVQEAFNHYRTATAAEIETRAAAIKQEISADPNADIDALNIELDGLTQAKANLQEKQTELEKRSSNLNPVTGMSFGAAAPISDDDIFGSKEYRSAFYKKMLDMPLSNEEAAIFQRANTIMAVEKRAAFINASEAAAVIPTQTLNEIYKLASDMGAVLSLVRRFDIPANIAVPVATPEEMAQWHTEGEEVTPDNKKPTNVIFSGYELMKVFSISAKARSMSINAYESYLQSELVRTLITAMQKAVIDGTGVNEPLGLLTTGVISKELLNQDPTYITFLKAAAILKRGYATDAVWAMNNATLYNDVMSICDVNGRPLFLEAKDGNADRILGKPIVIDDFIPDKTIIYGNFKYYGMNYPQDILLEVSRDSSFRKNLVDYRATATADGKPIIKEAFVKLTLKAGA